MSNDRYVERSVFYIIFYRENIHTTKDSLNDVFRKYHFKISEYYYKNNYIKCMN